jgi:hypothetical protein
MKKWLLNRFLPMWAKETVLAENRQLRMQNTAQKEKIRLLEAYIDGVQYALRTAKKINIYNRGGQE